MTSSAASAPRPRIPLNTLAISFGAAGFAAIWSLAAELIGFTPVIGDVLWAIAFVVWVWLIVAHIVRGAESGDSLATQLRHPVQGPIAALVPVCGMLFGAELYVFWQVGGVVLMVASLLVTAAYAAWILPFWMRGGINLDSVHGGWLLPSVAGGYVASLSAAEVGLRDLAIACFAIGTFFWVVMFVIVFVRMITRPPLPGPLVPTLAILDAPPALAGRAWFDIAGHNVNDIQLGIGALAILAVLMQLGLIPLYRQLKFTLGFWSFTFPLAAMGRYGIAWLAATHPAGWQVWSFGILAIVSVVVIWVAVLSVRLFFSGRRAVAEQQLERADAAAEK